MLHIGDTAQKPAAACSLYANCVVSNQTWLTGSLVSCNMPRVGALHADFAVLQHAVSSKQRDIAVANELLTNADQCFWKYVPCSSPQLQLDCLDSA